MHVRSMGINFDKIVLRRKKGILVFCIENRLCGSIPIVLYGFEVMSCILNGLYSRFIATSMHKL